MKSSRNEKSVVSYIRGFPADVASRLKVIRNLIFQHAPEAEESISYGMPAYKLFGKPLVYFAGYTHHIGFYALPSGHKKFQKELSMYKQGKGSVQFPLAERLPLDLIEKVIIFRKEENTTAALGTKKTATISKSAAAKKSKSK